MFEISHYGVCHGSHHILHLGDKQSRLAHALFGDGGEGLALTLPVREGAGQARGGSPCTAAPSWGPRLSPGKHSSRLGSQQEGDGPGTPIPSLPLLFLPHKPSALFLRGLSTVTPPPSTPAQAMRLGFLCPPGFRSRGKEAGLKCGIFSGSSSAWSWAPGSGEESPHRQQRDRTGTRPGRPSRDGVPASVVPGGHVSK